MTAPGVHYPDMPPMFNGEDADTYTDRLTGAAARGGGPRRPYDHDRGRQCSIGYHSECSQRVNGSTLGADGACQCPHHLDARLAAGVVHVAGFAHAAEQGRVIGDVETAAVDVMVDAMAATDAPLRALLRRWLTDDVHLDVVGCAGDLRAVLEGGARELPDGQGWAIVQRDGTNTVILTDPGAGD
jgi:hypothetical protein